jgi:hypothetical protein
MKTITHESYTNRIQINRDGIIRNYNPTLKSWKRFQRLSLNDKCVKSYQTFVILSASAFKK